MLKRALLWLGIVILLFCSGFSQSANAQLTKDHNYLPLRPPEGMKPDYFRDTRFDAHEFVSDASGKKTRAEGRKIEITYHSDASISALEIKRTLEEEAKAAGGKILYEADSDSDAAMTIFFQRDSTPVWVEIQGHDGYVHLQIIEEKKLHSDVMPSPAPSKPATSAPKPVGDSAARAPIIAGSTRPADAPAPPDGTDSTGRQRVAAGSTESILDATGKSIQAGSTEGLLDATGKPIQAPIAPTLKATGHVQVYVNFVTDSAQLQPSSNAVLNELAATLKASPELKVDLVGHTDAVGSDSHNMELSKRRAAAVYLWLVQHGISHDRLQSEGHGFLEPIATNESANGRALNRRVEVKTTG